jgi:protein-tyrosine phosphatase
MVDIHCHILPQVDDGATSWEIAAEMCRMAAADGITHIVATPHCNHQYNYDRARLEESLARLRQLAATDPSPSQPGLSFSLGCDFHFSYENMQAATQHPERYCISNSRYLLVELSDFSMPPSVMDALQRLASGGTTPIITHPERNRILGPHPERVMDFIERGCLVQVTGSALLGTFGERAQRSARWLLENGAAHALASDAHDTVKRPPKLSAARDAAAELCGEGCANALVSDNPRAIIAGLPLPYHPSRV